MNIAAGIDFGGTFVKIGLVSREGTIVSRDSLTVDAQESFEGTVEPVARCLKRLASRLAVDSRLVAIGIGTPGFVDKTEGALIGGCPNIPSLRKRSVRQYLEGAFRLPAFAENDATAAAAGELAFGAGRRYSNFVLITVGTAIGGGLVLDGKVYRGSRGFAGEIGHLCVSPGGLWCGCGSRGCFEQYASGSAIARVYAEKLRRRGLHLAAQTTAKEVVESARAGDALAVDTLEEAARWIAQAFGSILNILDLEACIVGGGVSRAGEILLQPVRRHLPDYCWPEVSHGVQVVAAELMNDAGILGAAAQAFERLGV